MLYFHVCFWVWQATFVVLDGRICSRWTRNYLAKISNCKFFCNCQRFYLRVLAKVKTENESFTGFCNQVGSRLRSHAVYIPGFPPNMAYMSIIPVIIAQIRWLTSSVLMVELGWVRRKVNFAGLIFFWVKAGPKEGTTKISPNKTLQSLFILRCCITKDTCSCYSCNHTF